MDLELLYTASLLGLWAPRLSSKGFLFQHAVFHVLYTCVSETEGEGAELV